MIKSLTKEVLEAEKSAYGKVIRVISHEVNNTVAGVTSVLDTVKSYAGVASKNSESASLSTSANANANANASSSVSDAGTVVIMTDVSLNLLEISDNGAGISKDTEQKLFTPFYSTKPNGQGIGLMTISEILTRHNFDFSLRTYPDGITRFKINMCGNFFS
ncbi:MAG: ATP-binding protein [Bacteroidales bacterium]|nr:ATP-binding protein [Bacteroidales bacterium]